MSLEERFWLRVTKDAGCWAWSGKTDKNGYGAIWYKTRNYRAHRVSWFMHFGVWPPSDRFVCHKCDNPPCTNPEHLFLGTPKDNVHDALSKGRINFRGADNYNAKLTDDQVLEIANSTGSSAAVCKKFGVCASTVRHIRNGRQWKSVIGATA